MVPTFQNGKIIITHRINKIEDIRIEYIVIYKYIYPFLICHRIINITVENGMIWIHTRGDLFSFFNIHYEDFPIPFFLISEKVFYYTIKLY